MIEIRNLCKRFDNGQDVLRNISFSVKAGEFVVVLGPSGAGKSTLLRCINFLSPPSSGEVLVDGISSAASNKKNLRLIRQRIAMVFQHHNLIGRLSVIKNVLTSRMANLSSLTCLLQLFPQADVDIATQAIAQVGLAEKAYARVDTLSGGQQQRVGIARALAQCPRLILADEPVASLDPKTSLETLSYLRKVSRENDIAVLCNLHQIDYAMEFATRIIGLSAGSIAFDGKPQDLTPDIIAKIYPGLSDPGVTRLVLRLSAELKAKPELSIGEVTHA